jgi:hypothetical protein
VAAKPGATWNVAFGALPGGPEELPQSYERARVTLMVVNSYLLHAYWDVDLTKLPPDAQSAVLRFQETTSPGHNRHTFDVAVDLRTRNWYIHLWSPAKAYEADLGVKTSAGQFVPLAHSNRLKTPRAWPVAPNLGTDGTFPPSAAPAVAPAPRTEPEVPRTEQPASAGPIPLPPAPPVSLQRVDAAEILQKKLVEIYSVRQWASRPAAALTPAGKQQAASSAETGASADSLLLPAPSDLTALAEHRFSPGFSSALPASAIAMHRPG